jgi:predicted ATPase
VTYWYQAGQRANERSAYVEAINHLTTGLALLQTMPDIPERAQHELRLQMALGSALRITKGYAASEVERIYARARELCQQVEDIPQLFLALWGLQVVYFWRGEIWHSQELATQLLTLAQRQSNPSWLAGAHFALGETLYAQGEFDAARAHLEQSRACYDSRQYHSYHTMHQGFGVACCSYLAFTLWMLGYPDQAMVRNCEAHTLAHEQSYPINLAATLVNTAALHYFRREVSATQEQAEGALRLAIEHGFPVVVSSGMVLRGWALMVQGRAMEGLEQMHHGLAASLTVLGDKATPVRSAALLAEAYGKAGQTADGLYVLEEALARAHATGYLAYEAELLRLRGELLLRQDGPDPSQAEPCFQQALIIARRQHAKFWELRATMSLARLWQCQGKRDAAQQLLAEVYNWFSEGFDTVDLQEAKVLLEELGSGPDQ